MCALSHLPARTTQAESPRAPRLWLRCEVEPRPRTQDGQRTVVDTSGAPPAPPPPALSPMDPEGKWTRGKFVPNHPATQYTRTCEGTAKAPC